MCGQNDGDPKGEKFIPNVNAICRAKTDDLRARLRLDKVVDFAVGNEILMGWGLREERELQVMKISCVRILGILFLPEVLEHDGVCSRQSHTAAKLLR